MRIKSKISSRGGGDCLIMQNSVATYLPYIKKGIFIFYFLISGTCVGCREGIGERNDE